MYKLHYVLTNELTYFKQIFNGKKRFYEYVS